MTTPEDAGPTLPDRIAERERRLRAAGLGGRIAQREALRVELDRLLGLEEDG